MSAAGPSASPGSSGRKRSRLDLINIFSSRIFRRDMTLSDRGFFRDLQLFVAYKIEGVPHVCVIAESRFIPLRTPTDETHRAAPGYPCVWQIADLRGDFPARPEYDAATGAVTNALPVGVVAFLSRTVDMATLFDNVASLGLRLQLYSRVLLCVPYFYTGGNKGSVDAVVDGEAWKVARHRRGLPYVPAERVVISKTLARWIVLVRDVVCEIEDWFEMDHVAIARPTYTIEINYSTLEIDVATLTERDMQLDRARHALYAAVSAPSASREEIEHIAEFAKKLLDQAQLALANR